VLVSVVLVGIGQVVLSSKDLPAPVVVVVVVTAELHGRQV
jgi:hypothetical protein